MAPNRRDDRINDTYFRRMVVPVTITILVLCAIAALIATPPGTPAKWNMFSSALPSAPQAALFKASTI